MESLFTQTEIEDAPETHSDSSQERFVESPLESQRFVIKSESEASREAIVQAIEKLDGGEIVSSGVGEINQEDINEARSENAVILGFQVDLPLETDTTGVDFHIYSVVYSLIEDVRDLLE